MIWEPQIEPTLLDQVDNAMEIAQEEVFAPVLAAIPYATDDEAIALANDSKYGLAGGVWSPDTERATAVARRLRTGVVSLNNPLVMDFGSPFGGFKQSGLGREMGPEGLAAYTELQSIIGSPPSP